MLGHFPVKIDVGEDGLAAAGHGLLGKLEYQYLGQLLDFAVAESFQIGSKEEVDRIPTDGAGKVGLQGGGELDHVGQKHLGMLGWLGQGQGVGQIQAIFFNVFKALSRTIGAVHKAQVVQVDIAPHV